MPGRCPGPLASTDLALTDRALERARAYGAAVENLADHPAEHPAHGIVFGYGAIRAEDIPEGPRLPPLAFHETVTGAR